MQVLAAPNLGTLDASVPPVPWPAWMCVSLEGLRVAVYADDGFFRPAPAVRRAVREASVAMRTRGAEVEEWVPPDVANAMRIFLGIASADGGDTYRRALGQDDRDRRISALLRAAGLPNRMRPAVARLLERAGQRHTARVVRIMGRRTAAGYWKLVEERAGLRARFLARLDAGRFDAIICPPHALPALTHGGSEYLLGAASYSLLYNVLGMPAGVVAATTTRPGEESDRSRGRDLAERAARKTEEGSAGLPVGVQVVARHWREDVALAVMAALEEHFRAQPDYPAQPPL